MLSSVSHLSANTSCIIRQCIVYIALYPALRLSKSSLDATFLLSPLVKEQRQRILHCYCFLCRPKNVAIFSVFSIKSLLIPPVQAPSIYMQRQNQDKYSSTSSLISNRYPSSMTDKISCASWIWRSEFSK